MKFLGDMGVSQTVIQNLRVLNECSQLLEIGAIITVETARYRVRKLPII